MDRDGIEVDKNGKEAREKTFSGGTNAGNPERASSAYPACSGSQ